MTNSVIEMKDGLATLPYRVEDPGAYNTDDPANATTAAFRVALPSSFERAVAFFESNKGAIEDAFRGKFVAIWQDTIIDSDSDFSTLASRVYGQLGYLPIYMPLVGSGSELRLRSPRVTGLPR